MAGTHACPGSVPSFHVAVNPGRRYRLFVHIDRGLGSRRAESHFRLLQPGFYHGRWILDTGFRSPRHVLVRVDGDAGAYLGNVVGRPTPLDSNLPVEMDGSRSVTNGDQIQTGWSVDYYGLSRTPREHGNGIGWRFQESEAAAEAQGNFGWPRKYVCSMCSLHWKAMPLPGKVIRGDVSQRDRIDLRIVCAHTLRRLPYPMARLQEAAEPVRCPEGSGLLPAGVLRGASQ
ncbi:hypothetical protein ColKHC_05865 [Colletotrichum higginsianum]|nr:hypothetical protein ColKHC_05865 [Colletotrichum higginsianum]